MLISRNEIVYDYRYVYTVLEMIKIDFIERIN